jgi:hypothetical protein
VIWLIGFVSRMGEGTSRGRWYAGSHRWSQIASPYAQCRIILVLASRSPELESLG